MPSYAINATAIFNIILTSFGIKFRVIKLQNGLIALLISDVHSGPNLAQDKDNDEGERFIDMTLLYTINNYTCLIMLRYNT